MEARVMLLIPAWILTEGMTPKALAEIRKVSGQLVLPVKLLLDPDEVWDRVVSEGVVVEHPLDDETYLISAWRVFGPDEVVGSAQAAISNTFTIAVEVLFGMLTADPHLDSRTKTSWLAEFKLKFARKLGNLGKDNIVPREGPDKTKGDS